MRKFWSNLAVQLGKRAGLVAVVGLLITGVLGAGISKLQFATGQDSYLNKGDQVAKDNVKYQTLFGGQIMIVLFTMDKGHTVADLADPVNRAAIQQAKAELEGNPHVLTVVSPIDTLIFSQSSLLRSPAAPTVDPKQWTLADATGSIASLAVDEAMRTDKDPQAAKIRSADFAATAARISPFTDTPTESKTASRTLSNPKWVDVLLHDNTGAIRKPLRSSFFDETHAQMIVRLKGNASIEGEGAGSDAVFAAWQKHSIAQGDPLPSSTSTKVVKCETDGGCTLGTITNGSTLVTGAPVLLKDINDYLRGGILSLGAIAIAIMMIILLIFFQVRWRLLPLAVVLVGVIWAFGMAGWIGIPLSIVTISGLPVMLGVGIDYAIQMHARIEEEVVIDRATHPIQETARNLGPALLVVTFDAIFAFAALRFAKVPMIRDFALLLCLGIALICLCSIIMPLAVLGIREYKSPTTGRDFREGYLGRLTLWLGDLPTGLAPYLIVGSLIIFIGGAAVESKLTLQTDPIQWVNQHSQHRKDVATLEKRTDASSELGIFVTSDNGKELLPDVVYKGADATGTPCFSGTYPDPVKYVVSDGCYTKEEAAKMTRDDKTMVWLETFTTDALERYHDKLLVGSSILSPLADLTDVKGAQNITPPSALVRASYESAPASVQKLTVTPDLEALNLLFITKPGDLGARSDMIDEMRQRFTVAAPRGNEPPAGVSATPSGLAVVGVGLLKNLESNRVQLTYLSIFFVFAFLTIRLRSLVRSLLSLVPVLIAVGLASLVAFTFSLKLSPMTAVGGPLVIAVCTEFTSLIILRFLEERGRGFSPRAAAEITATRTGRAFIVSGMTAVVGVAVIATSSLPLLRDFGLIVAMNVVVALLSALIILPPILVWAEERGWVSKGMIDPAQLGNKDRDEEHPTEDLATKVGSSDLSGEPDPTPA
ncbi:efflux RND transporter permease subunit [Aquihabitans sp. McL0605]|uniref:efflux RND transporter permease subunit n=1 Tax=Aquihabitans sp. McL0605 TaxID=3415671 RepID=UPI003CF59AEF